MPLSTTVSKVLIGLLTARSCYAAPAADQARDAAAALVTMPSDCTKPHLCYIHTTTTTAPNCPTCAKPTGIMCPMIIKIETTQVPCSNPCCPITPTQVVTKPCSACATGCVIPTQTVTETTGCGNPVMTLDPTAHVTISPGKA